MIHSLKLNDTILTRVNSVYTASVQLLQATFQKEYTSSGNLAIFARSGSDFAKIKNDIKPSLIQSHDPMQKYHKLRRYLELNFNGRDDIITHIYIRRFDPTEYGKYIGDMDFICGVDEYITLKESVISGHLRNCTMYDRPGWDTIQITHPDSPAVIYLGTIEMAMKARFKFDNLTKL